MLERELLETIFRTHSDDLGCFLPFDVPLLFPKRSPRDTESESSARLERKSFWHIHVNVVESGGCWSLPALQHSFSPLPTLLFPALMQSLLFRLDGSRRM